MLYISYNKQSCVCVRVCVQVPGLRTIIVQFTQAIECMGLAIIFHAVDTQIKCMHTQGVGEPSEPHSLYIISSD